jgi:uncharacterized protein YcnI
VTSLRTRVLVGTAALLGALALAAPASAHIDPDPTSVPAGSQATVAFTVEHGCEESDTTKLEIKVPDGVTDARFVAKEGWTGSTSDGVVTITGGPLGHDTEDRFSITFTAPATEGATLRFPIIQTCEVGSIDWISESEDDDHPAPVVTLGAPDPNATTTAPPTTTEPESTVTRLESTTTEAEATTTTKPDAASDDEDDDENTTATLIAGGVIGLLVVAGGAYVVNRRNRGAA